MDNKAVAILGLGSRSTMFYLSELNRLYNEKNGGYSTCPYILLNVNFDTINPLLPNVSDELDYVLQRYMLEIEKLPIEYVLVPNITLHETIDRLVMSKSIIHPLGLSVSKIKRNKWTNVVLFGSLHSMKSLYIRSYLKSNGIEVMLPTQSEMVLIDTVRKQVYDETETKDLIKAFHSLIAKYTENYPVMLACTELSIFNPKTNNLLDMAQVQIEDALRVIR